MRVACFLLKTVDKLEVISSKNQSPDFRIIKSDIEITVEVKKIMDKLDDYDRAFVNKSTGVLTKISDDFTIRKSIKNSNIKKSQYYQDIPHILMFDCSDNTIGEDEFEAILYPQKDKKFSLIDNQGNFLGYETSSYDGLFFKKNHKNNFCCNMISGIAAMLTAEIKKDLIKKERIMFFANPNASNKIDETVISSLNFQSYNEENY